MFRKFIDANVFASRKVDALLWPSMSIDGNQAFLAMTKSSVMDGLVIADVGGGKSPLFSPQEVNEKKLSVVGIDIDRDELAAAPAGAYEQTICADITRYCGEQFADVVVVQSLLEHVSNNAKGMRGIASLCKKDGSIYTFCPNRRAWFAILNKIMPEKLKRFILYAIYPHTRKNQGFPAYYDRCTPRELSDAMRDAGLTVKRIDFFFVSSYFMFFFPMYLFWRICTLPLMKIFPTQFCETFSIIACKTKG